MSKSGLPYFLKRQRKRLREFNINFASVKIRGRCAETWKRICCSTFVNVCKKTKIMKVETPSIAWHNRDRVSSIDFQPKPHPKPTQNGGTRIATGGDDNHVVVSWEFLKNSVKFLITFSQIWELVTVENGKIEPQCVCDLSRHQNSVNAVRWSPDGKILASADTGNYLTTHKCQKDSLNFDL